MVTHRPDGDVIELFGLDLGKQEVNFKKAFKHNLLFNINDVTVVDENKFYASSDSYYHHPPLKLLEYLTFRKWGRILLVDQDRVEVSPFFLYILRCFHFDSTLGVCPWLKFSWFSSEIET